MQPGTPQHRDLFCRTFVETHVAFEPAALPWPDLGPAHLGLLRRFPLWSHARGIEQRAGRMVTAFAQTVSAPAIRNAIALQGIEETRHGRLMAHVIERYGLPARQIALPDAPAVVDDFLTFGFGECSDSFVGFGAFAVVREKRVFPDALMHIFENVLWEEARHIVFFINWWLYELAPRGRAGLAARTADALRWHASAIRGTALDAASAPGLDLATIRQLMGDVTPQMFLAAALAENRRLMARFDRRLARPRLVPAIATILLTGLRLLPPRSGGPAPTAAGTPSLVA